MFQKGEVARLVGADQLRGERAIVGEIDLDFVGALDDVVVGEDVTVGGDDHARPERALSRHPRRPALTAAGKLLAEEPPEQIVRVLTFESGRRYARLSGSANRHDGGGDTRRARRARS